MLAAFADDIGNDPCDDESQEDYRENRNDRHCDAFATTRRVDGARTLKPVNFNYDKPPIRLERKIDVVVG